MTQPRSRKIYKLCEISNGPRTFEILLNSFTDDLYSSIHGTRELIRGERSDNREGFQRPVAASRMRSDVKSRESAANYARVSSTVNKTCSQLGSTPMPNFERQLHAHFRPSSA